MSRYKWQLLCAKLKAASKELKCIMGEMQWVPYLHLQVLICWDYASDVHWTSYYLYCTRNYNAFLGYCFAIKLLFSRYCVSKKRYWRPYALQQLEKMERYKNTHNLYTIVIKRQIFYWGFIWLQIKSWIVLHQHCKFMNLFLLHYYLLNNCV